MELVRNECSSNIGAVLANALLHDIKHLLKNDVDIKDILIDKCKLDRAKSKVKIVSEEVDSEQKKQLICLGVDSKLDQITKTNIVINLPQREVLKKCIELEHQLTFTYEDGKSSGNYLTHRTIPVTGATGLVLATETFSVLQELNSLESIQAVLLDNTATNTGPLNHASLAIRLLCLYIRDNQPTVSLKKTCMFYCSGLRSSVVRYKKIFKISRIPAPYFFYYH
nr:uncharacterized protein LOC124811150 [Hydra vulgaris]